MNFPSCIYLFFFLLSAFFCDAQVGSTEKITANVADVQKVKQDSTFPYFFGKHPTPEKNSFYFEIFGSSANLYSLNYDRCFFMHKLKREKWNRYSVRIGVNYYAERFAVPVMVLFSKGREYCFEAGAGWVPWFLDNGRVDGVAALVGFRLQPNKPGMLARFGLTPTYLVQEKIHWRMMYGFSFGYAF